MEAAERRLAELQAAIGEAETSSDEMVARLASLEQEIAAGTARQQELAAAVAVAEGVARAAPQAAGGGRSLAAVTAAVGTAPGLAEASDGAAGGADRGAGRRGACVTDALTAAVGAINRLTAAALVRGLGGC